MCVKVFSVFALDVKLYALIFNH